VLSPRRLQDIQAKHKLDTYDKIKDKAIFDMVRSSAPPTPCLPACGHS